MPYDPKELEELGLGYMTKVMGRPHFNSLLPKLVHLAPVSLGA